MYARYAFIPEEGKSSAQLAKATGEISSRRGGLFGKRG